MIGRGLREGTGECRKCHKRVPRISGGSFRPLWHGGDPKEPHYGGDGAQVHLKRPFFPEGGCLIQYLHVRKLYTSLFTSIIALSFLQPTDMAGDRSKKSRSGRAPTEWSAWVYDASRRCYVTSRINRHGGKGSPSAFELLDSLRMLTLSRRRI